MTDNAKHARIVIKHEPTFPQTHRWYWEVKGTGRFGYAPTERAARDAAQAVLDGEANDDAQ